MSSDYEKLVPYFIVYINGTRLAIEQEASVKQVLVTDRIDAPSVCHIVMSDADRLWADSSEFSEGQQVSVHLGTKDDIEEVFNGEITGLRAQYTRNTDDTTVIVCHDVLHRLKRFRKTATFADMADADIVQEILDRHGLEGDCDGLGTHYAYTTQQNSSDFDLVMEIAARHGCLVRAQGTCIRIKPIVDESTDVIVEWEKTLLDFSAQMDTTRQWTDVAVHSWNADSGEGVLGEARAEDISHRVGDGSLGGELVRESFGACQTVVVDPRVQDTVEAERLAMDILTRNSFELISGSGSCEGNYRIRAGSTLEVKELGGRFSGPYLLREVKHRLVSGTGFTTSFSGSRNTV
ncbi:phage late control D family protein [Alkalispirochaeta alkalica]|uniref:phage late control D family protein n=1 Tax=Alkalispirochaeta alkalica TaxID=46356 RepID=UPI00037F94B9|nr:contractile injection system protein, VgrG/Pvc8 family [Alkalispirochaeta alkalica]